MIRVKVMVYSYSGIDGIKNRSRGVRIGMCIRGKWIWKSGMEEGRNSNTNNTSSSSSSSNSLIAILVMISSNNGSRRIG